MVWSVRGSCLRLCCQNPNFRHYRSGACTVLCSTWRIRGLTRTPPRSAGRDGEAESNNRQPSFVLHLLGSFSPSIWAKRDWSSVYIRGCFLPSKHCGGTEGIMKSQSSRYQGVVWRQHDERFYLTQTGIQRGYFVSRSSPLTRSQFLSLVRRTRRIGTLRIRSSQPYRRKEKSCQRYEKT